MKMTMKKKILYTIITLITISYIFYNIKNELLSHSIVRKWNGIAKFCILMNADININTNHRYTLLHIAAGVDNVEMAKLLIRKGLDVNAKNINFTTPLIRAAAESASSEMIILLIMNGADVTQKDITGKTVLFYGVESGKIENIKALAPYIKSWNDTDNAGNTSLFMIKKWNFSRDVVKFLLNKGVNPYYRNRENYSFIDYAKKELTYSQYNEILYLISN